MPEQFDTGASFYDTDELSYGGTPLTFDEVMFSKITQYLKSLLTSNALVQEAYDYEVSDFNGQPAAVIVPSENDSMFSSDIHNDRVYAFDLFLFVSRDANVFDEQKCEDVTRDLVDSVLDDLDKNWEMQGLADLPTGYQKLFMEAAPSRWGYIKREAMYRMATVHIKVHVSIDTTLIS